MTSATLGHSDGRVDCSTIDATQVKSVLNLFSSIPSPDGAYLATILSTTTVYIWDARSSFRLWRKLAESKSLLTCLGSTAPGTHPQGLLAAGAFDGSVLVWEWGTLHLKCKLQSVFPCRVISINFFTSTEDERFAVAGDANRVAVCSAVNASIEADRDTDGLPSYAFSPPAVGVDRHAASNSFVMYAIRNSLWRLRANDGSLTKYTSFDQGISAFSFANTTWQNWIVGTDDGSIHVCMNESTVTLVPHCHKGSVTQLASSPNDELFISGSTDMTVLVWSWHSLSAPLAVVAKHASSISSIVIHPHLQAFATASHDGTAKVWQPDGSFVSSFRGHSGYIRGMAVDPHGNYFATASADHTIRIWPISGKQKGQLQPWSRSSRSSTGRQAGNGAVSPNRTYPTLNQSPQPQSPRRTVTPTMNKSAVLRVASVSPRRQTPSTSAGAPNSTPPSDSAGIAHLQAFSVVKFREASPSPPKQQQAQVSPRQGSSKSPGRHINRERDVRVVGRTPLTTTLTTYDDIRYAGVSSTAPASSQGRPAAAPAPQLLSQGKARDPNATTANIDLSQYSTILFSSSTVLGDGSPASEAAKPDTTHTPASQPTESRTFEGPTLSRQQAVELSKALQCCATHYNLYSGGILFHQTYLLAKALLDKPPTMQGQDYSSMTFRSLVSKFQFPTMTLKQRHEAKEKPPDASHSLSLSIDEVDIRSPLGIVTEETFKRVVEQFAQQHEADPEGSSAAVFALSVPSFATLISQNALRDWLCGAPLSDLQWALVKELNTATTKLADKFHGECFRFCSSILPAPSEGTTVLFPALSFATTDVREVYGHLKSATGLIGTLVVIRAKFRAARRVPSHNVFGSTLTTSFAASGTLPPSTTVVFPPSTAFISAPAEEAKGVVERILEARPSGSFSVWLLDEL
jgi:WD40 repeat protein